MENYKTVRGSAEATHVVERSRFIAHVVRVESREEAEAFIAKIKKQYWDARHNVYAYALKSGESRCSDDGEPSGTSGMPTLDVILKQGFSDVCIVTTRYFGGILLGTGGLVRAYSKAAGLALEAAGAALVAPCAVMTLTAPYAFTEKLQRFFKENACVVEDVQYTDCVTFRFYCESERRESVHQKLIEKFNGELSESLLKTEYKEL